MSTRKFSFFHCKARNQLDLPKVANYLGHFYASINYFRVKSALSIATIFKKSYAVRDLYISTAENAYRLCADLVMLLRFLLLLFYIELIALGRQQN